MWLITNSLLTLIGFSLVTFVVATPVDTFSTLKCHCISFSPAHNPNPCLITGSQNLDWDAARNLASHHQMKIQFATQDTITRVLEVATPLPTSVLLSMSNEKPLLLDHAGALESVQKIVCGVDDEVRQRWMEMSERESSGSDWFVAQVIVSLILLIVMYEVIEVAWTWMFPTKAPIRLSGEEKLLRVYLESENHTIPNSEKGSTYDEGVPQSYLSQVVNTTNICSSNVS